MGRKQKRKQPSAPLNQEKTTTQPAGVSRRNHVLAVFVITALSLFIYANSLGGEFVWDDVRLITDNPEIKSIDNIGVIFKENIGAQHKDMHSTYRPLQMLTHMIDFKLWGLKTFGHHLTNIFLHAGAGVCFYALLVIIFGNAGLALIAAVLFIVHPVHNEAVAYISGRADSLMAIFFLLTAYLYIRSAQSRHWLWFSLMSVCFILALLAKEYALILPVLMAAYHVCLGKKWAVKEWGALVVLSAVFVILRVTETIGLMRLHTADETTLSQRLPGVFVALYEYLRLLIVPVHLHMEYGRNLFSFTHPKAVLGCVFFAALLVPAVMFRKKNPLITFSIAWFLLALFPVSNLISVNAFMAEHWLYIPSIGIFVLAAHGITRAYEQKNLRGWSAAAAAVVVMIFSFLVIQQNRVWSEPAGFYQYTLKYAPESARLNNNLGTIYLNRGEYRMAEKYIRKAIEVYPDYASAYNNLGMIYSYVGPKEKVAALYERAIELDPKQVDAMNNLAVHYATEGKLAKAVALFQKITQINPNITDAYMNLCVIHNKMGKKQEAIAACEQALKLNPLLAHAYNNIAVALNDTGRKRQAISAYKKSLRINPDDYYVLNNLGALYYELGDVESAQRYFQDAVRLNPRYTEANKNLAIVSALKP